MSFLAFKNDGIRQHENINDQILNAADDITSDESAFSYSPDSASDYDVEMGNVLPIQLHLLKNQTILACNTDPSAPPKKRWRQYKNLFAPDSHFQDVVRKPTASKIFHGNIHPGLYRNLTSLDNRASISRSGWCSC